MWPQVREIVFVRWSQINSQEGRRGQETMSFVVNAPFAVVGSRARLFNHGPFQRSCVTEELKTRPEDARAKRRRGHGDAPRKHRALLYRRSARQRIRWAGETGVAACDAASAPEHTLETNLAGPIRVGGRTHPEEPLSRADCLWWKTSIQYEAYCVGTLPSLIFKMLVIIITDALAGSIPIAGDLIDAALKASKINVQTLKDHLGAYNAPVRPCPTCFRPFTRHRIPHLSRTPVPRSATPTHPTATKTSPFGRQSSIRCTRPSPLSPPG